MIINTSTPSEAGINFLTNKINQENPEYGPARPFGFFKKNEEGIILAGCNGFIMFGSIYTDQLWVDNDHRDKGLGKQLMSHVHDLGRKSDCVMATVQTMDFQNALSFYIKLGYKIDYQRKGYVKNASCYFLSMEL